MRALITGAGGFVGGHLCAYLLAHTDWQLMGTVYPRPVEAQPPEPRLRLRHADLRDPEGVRTLVGGVQPDYIFHLAAQSFVPTSFADPWDTLENNIRAELNLLEAVRRSGREIRVLVIGSNEEYGAPKPGELPQTEESPLRPNNPYAVSKVAQDFLGLQYHLAYGLPVVRVRPFNHTGPGQSPRFVVPAFASQIARIEAGLQEPVMKVGNLDAARDFSDVRDIVWAYHLAVTQGEPGEVYNLASGRPQPVRGLLEILLGYSQVEIRVERDPERYRPVDVPVAYGSAEKFGQQTGWEPQIPFEQTLRDVLEYWRGQVAGGRGQGAGGKKQEARSRGQRETGVIGRGKVMHIVYPDRANFNRTLREADNNSLDFIVVATAALNPLNLNLNLNLDECARVLKNGGLLFVQGRPEYLPELGVYLDQYLNFKYWIAIESTRQHRDSGLPSVHAAVLLFTKGNGRLNVRRTRFPHQYCAFCKRTLKDWGGKAHLMHPDGYVISDVWTGLPQANNYTQISAPVLDTILRMLDFEPHKEKEADLFEQTGIQRPASTVKGLIGPKEGLGGDRVVAEPAAQYRLPGFLEPDVKYSDVVNEVGDKMFDVVHHGDAVEILKQYPDNSIDLVFADPPYNLDKAYHVYDDERADEEYVKWCNAWLGEYVRILKPSGSLYVLNLPHWTMYHAAFLNRYLCFQNWIVWDALSEPRGKLMPAHYGLLFYTKHPTDFTFNYDEVGELDARYYCLRSSCIRKRKAMGADDKMGLTDLWWDIHRIKHKRDRDYHPCQLPDALMERIIRLSTNEGDIVLDALCGAGTTPVTAVRLGRRYVAIDVDERYVRMTREKIAEVKQKGYVERKSIRKPQREYTKKELQLELRDLAAKLGRLPTPKDVQEMSKYDPDIFFAMFPTWGKALKAAKLEVQSS